MTQFHLDVRHDVEDREFLQFQAAAFNSVIAHYEKLWNDPQARVEGKHLIFAAEVLLKAKNSYDIWVTTGNPGASSPAIAMLLRWAYAVAKVYLKG